MLSKEQVSFFDTFGYLVFRGLYSEEEMAVIDRDPYAAIENGTQTAGTKGVTGGAPRTGTPNSPAPLQHDGNPKAEAGFAHRQSDRLEVSATTDLPAHVSSSDRFLEAGADANLTSTRVVLPSRR